MALNGLQQIAIDCIVRSAVSIEHNFSAPTYDKYITGARKYNKENHDHVYEWHRKYKRANRGELCVNPKWKRCFGGRGDDTT
jgi:hypothetical protein